MKKLIIHPWLLAIFPIIFLYNVNRDMLEIKDIFFPFALVFISSAAVFLLLNYFIKDKRRSAIITSFFFLFFFSYGHYINFISPKLFFPQDIIINQITSFIFLFTWILVAAILAYLTIHTKKNLSQLNEFLNIVAIIFIFLQLSSLIIYLNNPRLATGTNPVPQNNTANTEMPDIYYIILDAYGRNDILKDIYGYDNGEFISYLKNSGFYVAEKAHANYPQTYLSISSSLNLNYLQNILPAGYDTTSNDRKIYKDLIKNHKVYYFLKKEGYKFIGLPNTWIGTVNNQNIDININPKLSLNNFNKLIINTTPLKLLHVNSLYYNKQRHQVLSVFDSLPTVAKYNFPTFTYVHLMMPHPPFIFSADGKPNNPPIYTMGYDGDAYFKLNPDKSYYQKHYIEQLKFLNKNMEKVIKKIISNSATPPIIIIQGDHGPGLNTVWESPKKTNMKERLSILNAYYLPPAGQSQLYESITPINSFRIVLNSIFNTGLKLLPDKSYFATWSQPYNFIDVNEKLKD